MSDNINYLYFLHSVIYCIYMIIKVKTVGQLFRQFAINLFIWKVIWYCIKVKISLSYRQTHVQSSLKFEENNNYRRKWIKSTVFQTLIQKVIVDRLILNYGKITLILKRKCYFIIAFLNVTLPLIRVLPWYFLVGYRKR